MAHLYPLLIYIGLLESFALLVMELIPRLHPWRKVATAFSLTLVTLLWLALPLDGRWLLSAWSPSVILGGWILVDMTPAIWWVGLALGVALAGAAWVELAESRPLLPMAGGLALLSLLVTWFALAGGSLLTVLAGWAIFDLFWAAVGLMSGGDGERVTFGLAVHGVASLVLWGVFLLLERSGISVFWWLMWPTPAVLTLLVVAAMMRIGAYPFHIVLPRQAGNLRTLGLVSLMGPVLGFGLLYRLMILPGGAALPDWLAVWGGVSLLWCGLMAWTTNGPRAVLWSIYALAGLLVMGAATAAPALVMAGLTAWIAGGALLFLSRNRMPGAIVWVWPAWAATLFLAGVPPSPLGALYREVLVARPWAWRLALLVGWLAAVAALLRAVTPPAQGDVTPPRAWQRASVSLGLLFPLLALAPVAWFAAAGAFSWLGLGLWLLTFVAATLLRWRGRVTRRVLRRAQPLWDALDGWWLYRALWRGLEHLLSVVGVLAEVVEGSGALLWSLLVLLLIFVVVTSR